MELNEQIRKHRDRLSLSQEELAEKVFVTRQSISNWENGKTYPDLQSLLRLSDLFGLTLDKLIKGDIEVMKQEINEVEVRKMDRLGNFLGLLMLALILLPVPILKWLDTVGFLLTMGPLFAVTLLVGNRVEKLKKENNVYTYKEIVAFSEGKHLDEIEKAREDGKRPYQQFLLAAGVGVLAMVVAVLMFRLLE